MVYIEALSKVLPIILLLLVGVLLNRMQFVRPETVQEIKKLVVNVTLPALLFLAFSQVRLELQYFLIVGFVFAACFVVMLLGRIIRPALHIDSPYFPMLLTGFEAGMMGYAIYSAVYGQENIYKFGIIDLGQVVFVFFVLVTVLERFSTGSKPFRETLAGFFKTPVILSIFAGVIFNQTGLTAIFTDWPLTNSIFETLSLMGSLTTPLVAMVIGYEMQLQSGDLLKPSLNIASRLFIWVPIGLLLNFFIVDGLLNLDPTFQAAVMTMFILPPPFIIPLFMSKSSIRDRDYVVNSLTISTIATLFAFSIVTVLYPPVV